MNADELSGEPSFGYTRADALRTGILLDIAATACVCARLRVPTAMTAGLWHALMPGEPFDPQHEGLKTVLYGLLFGSACCIPNRIVDTPSAQIMVYAVVLGSREIRVKAAAHVDANGHPVCTLMLASQD